ncbi:hypothetical protein VTJ04DRAFT_8986 [Mycothermus thermophilus]|uniref:uncharacterized protein n=1 Tax=Humicola insolens TaxID=85995 RepID=UPI003743684D
MAPRRRIVNNPMEGRNDGDNVVNALGSSQAENTPRRSNRIRRRLNPEDSNIEDSDVENTGSKGPSTPGPSAQGKGGDASPPSAIVNPQITPGRDGVKDPTARVLFREIDTGGSFGPRRTPARKVKEAAQRKLQALDYNKNVVGDEEDIEEADGIPSPTNDTLRFRRSTQSVRATETESSSQALATPGTTQAVEDPKDNNKEMGISFESEGNVPVHDPDASLPALAAQTSPQMVQRPKENENDHNGNVKTEDANNAPTGVTNLGVFLIHSGILGRLPRHILLRLLVPFHRRPLRWGHFLLFILAPAALIIMIIKALTDTASIVSPAMVYITLALLPVPNPTMVSRAIRAMDSTPPSAMAYTTPALLPRRGTNVLLQLIMNIGVPARQSVHDPSHQGFNSPSQQNSNDPAQQDSRGPAHQNFNRLSQPNFGGPTHQNFNAPPPECPPQTRGGAESGPPGEGLRSGPDQQELGSMPGPQSTDNPVKISSIDDVRAIWEGGIIKDGVTHVLGKPIDQSFIEYVKSGRARADRDATGLYRNSESFEFMMGRRPAATGSVPPASTVNDPEVPQSEGRDRGKGNEHSSPPRPPTPTESGVDGETGNSNGSDVGAVTSGQNLTGVAGAGGNKNPTKEKSNGSVRRSMDGHRTRNLTKDPALAGEARTVNNQISGPAVTTTENSQLSTTNNKNVEIVASTIDTLSHNNAPLSPGKHQSQPLHDHEMDFSHQNEPLASQGQQSRHLHGQRTTPSGQNSPIEPQQQQSQDLDDHETALSHQNKPIELPEQKSEAPHKQEMTQSHHNNQKGKLAASPAAEEEEDTVLKLGHKKRLGKKITPKPNKQNQEDTDLANNGTPSSTDEQDAGEVEPGNNPSLSAEQDINELDDNRNATTVQMVMLPENSNPSSAEENVVEANNNNAFAPSQPVTTSQPYTDEFVDDFAVDPALLAAAAAVAEQSNIDPELQAQVDAVANAYTVDDEAFAIADHAIQQYIASLHPGPAQNDEVSQQEEAAPQTAAGEEEA